MKKSYSYFLLFFTMLLQAVSINVLSDSTTLTAEAVMLAVDDRYDGDTRKQAGTMILIDKKKRKRVREFIELSKRYGENERSISHILSPAEVRGTAFLSYEWQDRSRDDESWLYLPQLKKVKRLASTDKSSYFLGSDFTYADLIGLEVEDFEYEFIHNEGGAKHWVIIARPKAGMKKKVIEETGYKKIKYWVSKEKTLIEKAQYWLDEGNKIKYLTISDIEKIDGIWTAKNQQMILTQGGKYLHASVYQTKNIQYNLTLDDEDFTTYAMEKNVR